MTRIVDNEPRERQFREIPGLRLAQAGAAVRTVHVAQPIPTTLAPLDRKDRLATIDRGTAGRGALGVVSRLAYHGLARLCRAVFDWAGVAWLVRAAAGFATGDATLCLT